MRLITASLLMVALTGCVVPKAVYEDLQEELNVTRRVLDAQNSEIQTQIATQDEALRQAETDLEASKLVLGDLEKENESLDESIQKITLEKAELIKSQANFDQSVEELQRAIVEAERAMVLEARVFEKEEIIGDLRGKLQTSQVRADALQRKSEQMERQVQLLNVEKSALMSDRSELETNIEEMTQALNEAAARQAIVEERLGEYQELLARFQPLIDSGKLKVKVTDGRMIVELPTDVLFGSGSATLSADGQSALKEVAEILASIPDKQYQVEGHTDNVPISTQKYPSNWELASARAITVVKTMTEGGMESERVSAAAYGEFHPITENETTEDRAANRRIEIVVVPDLSTLPGYDELTEMTESKTEG